MPIYVESETPTAPFSDMPALAVEVAITDSPRDGADWIDVTPWLREGSTQRGRQRLLDRFEAGRATIMLNNQDRRFDPTFTGGPYYGRLVPNRQMRIRALWAGTWYYVFTGLVDSWTQEYPQSGTNTVCTLQATDAFKVLSAVPVFSSPWALSVYAAQPSLWWRLNETVGSTTAQDQVGNSPLTTSGSPTFGTTSIIAQDTQTACAFDLSDLLLGTCNTNGVNGGLDGGALSVECWYATTDSSAGIWDTATTGGASPFAAMGVSSGNVYFAVTDTSSNQVQVPSTGVNVADGNPHHIVATYTSGAGTSTKLYVDGVDVTGTPSNSDNAVVGPYLANRLRVGINAVQGFGTGTLQDLVIYDYVLAATTVAQHYADGYTGRSGDTTGARIGTILDGVGWPSNARDIDTGNSLLQEDNDADGNALSMIQRAVDSENGAFYIRADGKTRFRERQAIFQDAVYQTSNATFGDSTGELHYENLNVEYDDDQLANVVSVTRNGGAEQVSEDTDSQAQYFQRLLSRSGLIVANDNDAKSLSEYLLARYKRPFLVFTDLRLQPRDDPSNLWPQVLGRELEERLTIKRRPLGVGSAISQDALIQGIEHRFGPASWATTFWLSAADVDTAFLTLDDTLLGRLDVNILGY